jgi:hypothetical protein
MFLIGAALQRPGVGLTGVTRGLTHALSGACHRPSLSAARALSYSLEELTLKGDGTPRKPVPKAFDGESPDAPRRLDNLESLGGGSVQVGHAQDRLYVCMYVCMYV